MKIGIVPINTGGPTTASTMLDVARHAEAAGVESVWTFEHAMMPTAYKSRYPYDRSGKMPLPAETHLCDPLISLAHIAAATSKIRLGTGINILPQTNPLLFAKQTATLDALSNGRLELGLGLGWLAEEYEAMGTSFARRGARFDDYLAAIKKVWTGDEVEHQSEFLNWHHFKSFPIPLQSPHPPLHIGGATRRTLQRVVDSASGWYAPSDSVAFLGATIEQIKQMADEAGRSMTSIEITASWRPKVHPNVLANFEEIGVARVVVMLNGVDEESPLKAIDEIARIAKL